MLLRTFTRSKTVNLGAPSAPLSPEKKRKVTFHSNLLLCLCPPPLHPAPDLFVLESDRWVHRCAPAQPSLFLPESSASVACASHLNGSSARLFSLLLSDYFSVLVHKRKLRKACLCCCIAETRHSWLLVWCGGGKKRWPKPASKWHLGDVRHSGSAHQSLWS